MINDFFRRLTAPQDVLRDPNASRIALAALLVRIARADGVYDNREIARIDRVLVTRYGLSPFDAAALRASAEKLEESAPDTVRFTRTLKDQVPLEERAAILRALWEVALADGERDHGEDALMRMIAPLLGFTDQDSHRIRLEVSRGK